MAAVVVFCCKLLIVVVAEVSWIFPLVPLLLIRILFTGALVMIEPNAVMSI